MKSKKWGTKIRGKLKRTNALKQVNLKALDFQKMLAENEQKRLEKFEENSRKTADELRKKVSDVLLKTDEEIKMWVQKLQRIQNEENGNWS